MIDVLKKLMYGAPKKQVRRKRKGATPAQRKAARKLAAKLKRLEADKAALQEKAALQKAIEAGKSKMLKLQSEISKLK